MKRFKYLTLAALVAFGACDDGGDVVVQPDITGTISGVVTIEGAAASGVTVTLSSGTTATTDASGAYTFAGVDAGAYTVSISGFATDATFSATSKAATIATAGQVVTVNFDGSFVRTSAIIGSVAAGGQGLAGVTVSIGAANTTTDANGQYSFSGLRAGTYTVALSGFDATQYSFANASQNVTVAVGESKVVSFSGLLLSTATVSGSLYLDELGGTNDMGDLTFTAGVEPKLRVANVRIGLERAVGDTIYTVTDANGDYTFADLEAGTYKVVINPTQTAIPGNVAFAAGATPVQLVTVTAGGTAPVHWPFRITTQRVEIGAFLGTDATGPGLPGPRINPLPGVTIDLYPTETTATAGAAAGRIGTATTGADGTVTFRFARTADISPAGAMRDNVVFARYRSVNTTNKSLNGESVIEIKYAPTDSVKVSDDDFDLLNSGIILRYRAHTIRGDTLGGWNAALYRNDTTTATTAIQTGATNASGLGRFVETTGPAALPDTFYIRLSGAQPFANTLGHGWRQAPSAAAAGMSAGRYLRIVHDGTQPDSVMLGTEQVTFTDMHLIAEVHHERDDSTNIPTFTGGDNVENMDRIQVQLYSVAANGTRTSVGTAQPSIDSGSVVFFNVPIGNYELRARSTFNSVVVLNDTAMAITLDGAWRDTTHSPLTGGAGKGTFAFKYNNTQLTGLVRAADGTNVNGARVTIRPSAMNTQPGPQWLDATPDTTITVTGGAWALTGLREGPYEITASVGDSSAVWELVSYTGSGNTSATMATRDLQNNNDDDIANFRAVRLDTRVIGLVINDRDQDLNVIDPDEALAGAVIELYKDNSGAATVSSDSLVATSTTDANGRYSFTGLREGRYIVKWQTGTPSAATDVLRGLAKDTAVVTTAATTTGSGANNTRTVGNHTPNTLPRWNYSTSEGDGGILPNNFTFLFKNTTVSGTVQTGAAAGVQGMTVSLRRCDDSMNAASPPVAVDPDGPDNVAGNADDIRCSTFLGTTQNAVSDASGKFSFTGLIEGVYQVTPQPGTVGGFTTSNPSAMLYLTVGNADVEDATFTVS